MEVDLDGLRARFPRPLTPEEDARLVLLAADALSMIRVAFMKQGRDFDAELRSVPWLELEAQRVVRHMVNAAVLVGGNVGVRSVSSTTGQESDSITYADVDAASWGGVRLTEDLLALLGLGRRGARGSFPEPLRWPESYRPRGGERWWR